MAARTDGATMLMIMIPGGPGRHGRPSRSPPLGIWLIVANGLAQGALLGNLAALVSAIGFSVFILSARWGRQADMLPMVVSGALFSAAVSAFAADPLAVSPHDGAVSFAMAAVMLDPLSRVIPAAEASLIGLTEVLLAPF